MELGITGSARHIQRKPFPYREKFLDDGETPRRLHHPIVFVLPDAERWIDLVEADPVPLPPRRLQATGTVSDVSTRGVLDGSMKSLVHERFLKRLRG